MSAETSNRTKLNKDKKSGTDKIIGNIKYHREFYSEYLKNRRDIFVWLPSGYYSDKTKKYPVLYMHDGQNLVDPKTSFAGMDWRVDEMVTKLN